LEHPPYSPDLAPCHFWAFSAMKRELWGKKFEVIKRSKLPVPLSSWSLWQTVHTMFLRSGWSVVRSSSLAKGGTLKERPSLHLHKVSTQSNKVRPRTFQTALV
jgi:hypothetical protein